MNGIELIDTTPNASVVRVGGRTFPGLVLQGDTLNNLVSLLSSGSEDEISEALEILSGAQSHYETVCKAKGIELPYKKD